MIRATSFIAALATGAVALALGCGSDSTTDMQMDPAAAGAASQASVCPEGLVSCNGVCVNTAADPANCGACNIACGAGQSCVSGVCTCPDGQTYCDNSCVDTQVDAANCGSCGNICPAGTTCSAGACLAGTGGSDAAGGTTSATGGARTGGTGGQPTGGTGGEPTSGTGGDSTGGTGGTDPVNVSYIMGADISFVQEQEDQGRRFSDNGAEKDILEILKDHGFNYIRLRIFHNPGSPGGYQYEFTTRAEPYCDLDHTVEMAQRVKAANMGLLLDFHYSDTWADPDDQHKPAAWEGLSFTELTTAVHDYTRDTLLALEAAGALPDMVQVGNEITPGMLLPDGATYDPNNWDQLAVLLTAGLSAVKEVSSSIKTMLHIDRGGDNSTSVWWVDEALSRGVSFEILGQSCYSVWHGEPSVWQANFNDLAGRYPDLSFVIAEYADNYRAANDIMYNLSSGLGTFFWEPTVDGEWGTGLFDYSGQTRSTITQYDRMAQDYGLR